MTDHEKACAEALSKVSIYGTAARKFVDEMDKWRSTDADRTLSQKQTLWLASLVCKYREKVGNELLVQWCRNRIGEAERAQKWGPATFKA